VLVNPESFFLAAHTPFFVCGVAAGLRLAQISFATPPARRFNMAAAAAVPKEMRAIVIDAKGGE
jgi:hypothetical protein